MVERRARRGEGLLIPEIRLGLGEPTPRLAVDGVAVEHALKGLRRFGPDLSSHELAAELEVVGDRLFVGLLGARRCQLRA